MEIICPICKHADEVEDFEDKMGWECDSCGRAWEITPAGTSESTNNIRPFLTRHPLVTAKVAATYDSPYLDGGRVRIK